ncbi:MAG: RNA methyltransferase [Bacteroidota bacterium]|nr:RNA methyltransferase [Bacteroidota bacterium]
MPPLERAQAESLRSLVREASERAASSSFVIEGPHLLERAFESAADRIKEVVFTEEALLSNSALAKRAQRKGISIFRATPKLAEKISDTKTPQGVFAVISMPSQTDALPDKGVVIALDDVQDPGNVGTIIRTASWFGASRILLSTGCADPYSPKVLRATQGEIFGVAVGNRGDLRQNIVFLQKRGFQVVAATVEPSACLLYKMAFDQNVVLIFGSEASGISKPILGLADGQIVIPKYGLGESLNVATSAGIVLSEVMRKRS